MRRFVTLAIIGWLAGGEVAQAQPLTFFGSDNPRGTLTNSFAARNAFFAALTSHGTDDIESIPPFTPQPSLTFAGVGRSATTTCTLVAPDPTLAVSGSQLLLGNLGDVGNPLPNLSDTFSFNGPVTGFGMFFTQVGDLTNVTTLTLRLQNTATGADLPIGIGTFGPGRPDDAVFFFGAIDTVPFNRVVLTKSTANDAVDGILYDDVSVGLSPVPEPGTLALSAVLLAGGGALTRLRRRLKRQSQPGRR